MLLRYNIDYTQLFPTGKKEDFVYLAFHFPMQTLSALTYEETLYLTQQRKTNVIFWWKVGKSVLTCQVLKIVQEINPIILDMVRIHNNPDMNIITSPEIKKMDKKIHKIASQYGTLDKSILN